MTETSAVRADSGLPLFDCKSRRAAQVLPDTPRLDGPFDLAQIREVAGDTCRTRTTAAFRLQLHYSTLVFFFVFFFAGYCSVTFPGRCSVGEALTACSEL